MSGPNMLAMQIAGLTGDIRNLGKRIPSYQRGVVANVSPPTVIMDRDVTATPRPVADVLVPGLAVGQRVEVRVIGSRRVITSIHPGDNEPDDTGFIDISSGTPPAWGAAGIYVRRSGVNVSLHVQVVVGTAPSGTLLQTLAQQFRPVYQVNDAAVANAGGGTAVQAILGTDGQIRLYWPGSMSADNIIRWQSSWMV